MDCTCGKCLEPSERHRQLNKDRYDVLSIPSYVIEKNPSHGARHGSTMRQKIYHKTHNMLKKAQKKQCTINLERWYKSDLYRGSLSKIGWNEATIMAYDKIAFEDHSHTATREERSRNENSWKPSLNAEGANGPLDQRDDFKDVKERHAKDCTMSIQQLLRQFLHSNKSDKGPTSSSRATKNIRTDLVHPGGNAMFQRQYIRLHLCHHGGSETSDTGVDEHLNTWNGLLELLTYDARLQPSDETELATSLQAWKTESDCYTPCLTAYIVQYVMGVCNGHVAKEPGSEARATGQRSDWVQARSGPDHSFA